MIEKLGFKYNRQDFVGVQAVRNVERACYRFEKRYPQYIWNESTHEGKAYTYPQVKTILDGVTAGGRKITDELDIRNQKASLDALIRMVRSGKFKLDMKEFCDLHELAAKEEALEWGVFRTGSVGIAGSKMEPPSHDKLRAIFKEGIEYIRKLDNPVEQAIIFFLFGAVNQFFFDGNKRTSRLMMNGVLLANGCDALMIPAKLRFQYNTAMLELYDTRNASAAIKFLLNCYKYQDTNLSDE